MRISLKKTHVIRIVKTTKTIEIIGIATESYIPAVLKILYNNHKKTEI